MGRRCAGPPERNWFHLVQLAHGHSRRVAEVVSAFEQSLNAVLWHGSVEGRSDFLDEGYCCPYAGRFVFCSCDKPLITPWRSVHQIRNLFLGQLRGSVTDHGVWPRLLDDFLAFVPCAHDCACSWLYLEPCERLIKPISSPRKLWPSCNAAKASKPLGSRDEVRQTPSPVADASLATSKGLVRKRRSKSISGRWHKAKRRSSSTPLGTMIALPRETLPCEWSQSQ